MTGSEEQPNEDARLFQTAVRESLTPYLPPPVVKAVRAIDPILEPLVGPEASVTVFGSLLVAWIFYQLLRIAMDFSSGSSASLGRKNSAIQEDDRDKDILPSGAETSRPFDGTVLLCGPSLGGKTCLFYELTQPRGSNSSNSWTIATVRSIKSNTGFLEPNGSVLRLLDTPGHWGPQKLVEVVPLREVQRLVVVVDSTQPVAPAADYLYAILTSTIQRGSGSSHANGNNDPAVLIACHKGDHTKAKNPRRIKLQLRNELIRLSKLDEAGGGDDTDGGRDWEGILNNIPLCSSSVSDSNAVREFCETGRAPLASKKR
ncbi:unnamed protein product [Pseudo-nitzschia multistriata]|uniref:Signal recognition particle receptor subunit beta n=1 Tax=Pseudo-nitzschia multistriata TaxID=183589 RepID=A0A448Z894_9STRA|nr:unnamed protein product [Pseudo-nitzschia multistriata]